MKRAVNLVELRCESICIKNSLFMFCEWNVSNKNPLYQPPAVRSSYDTALASRNRASEALNRSENKRRTTPIRRRQCAIQKAAEAQATCWTCSTCANTELQISGAERKPYRLSYVVISASVTIDKHSPVSLFFFFVSRGCAWTVAILSVLCINSRSQSVCHRSALTYYR